MNTQAPFKILLTHFAWNLQRLEDMQNNERNEYYRNASLQRYEFAVHSALKCLQARAELDHRSCETVEEGFQWAGEMGWFPDNADWKEMADAYQKMTPDQIGNDADAIFDKLKIYHTHFRALLDNLTALDPS